MKTILVIAIGIFGFVSAATAQTDFSGTWILKEQKIITGQLYSNGVPKEMVITQTGDVVTIDKTTASADADVKTSETPGTEAKPFVTTTPSKRKKLITIKWDTDHKGFTEIANLYSAADNTKLEITYTDHFSMEDVTLVLLRKVENLFNGDNWSSTSTYDKP
jgi:hypothetical protein